MSNQMEDIQNVKGNYKFNINSVGVKNLTHRICIKNNDEDIHTVGKFTLGVSLSKETRGINMSRIPISLFEFSGNEFIINDFKEDTKTLLKNVIAKMECDEAKIEIEFQYFINKKAPVSDFVGVMAYNTKVIAKLNKNNAYDYTVSVEIPITTLCPCSKAISEYSAHNQRGYVTAHIKYVDKLSIEEIVNMVEEISSCEVYPILKRVDEKFVTEKAYENPRFVEDIVRMTAERFMDDERIIYFKVSSRHQESIHPYDAYAVIEVDKGNKNVL